MSANALHRVHVLGAGSIGLQWAFYLARSGVPVTLLLRNPQARDAFAASGSHITLERNGDLQKQRVDADASDSTPNWARSGSASPAPLAHSTGAQHACSPSEEAGHLIHTLVVATKAHDAAAAVAGVQHRLGRGSTLVLLQNGILALYEQLHKQVLSGLHAAHRLPRVVVGSTTHGCFTRAPFHVVHAGLGTCTLAQADARQRTLLPLAAAAGVGSAADAQQQDLLPQVTDGNGVAAATAAASASAGHASGSHTCFTAGLAHRHPGGAAAAVHTATGSTSLGATAAELGSSGSGGCSSRGRRALGRARSTAHVGQEQVCKEEPQEAPVGATPHLWRDAEGEDVHALMARLSQVPGLGALVAPTYDHFIQQLHVKLAISCCLNPITALLGCPNGGLAAQAPLKAVARAVCGELAAVLAPWLGGLGQEELLARVMKVAADTAHNRSSMLQDVSAGRTTEAEFLNGYVLRQAAQRGLVAPTTAALHHLVLARTAASTPAPPAQDNSPGAASAAAAASSWP